MFASVIPYRTNRPTVAGALAIGIFWLLMPSLLQAQVPDVGPGQCVETGHRVGGYSCGSTGSGSYARTVPRSRGPSHSSGPSARQRAYQQHQQIMNNMMLNTMQGLMGNFMQGIQRGMELNRQRQLQAQEEMLRRARAEMERERQRALAAQRAMQRNRQQLQEAKARIAGAVRSMSATGTPMRPVLRVGEEQGALGATVLKPRGMSDVSATDPRSKIACGQELLNAAGSAAVSGSQDGLVASFKEAAFLSRQANQAVSGGQLDVSCPGNDPDPDFAASDDLNMINETIKRQSEVFGALYEKVADNMGAITERREQLAQNEERVEEAKSARDKALKAVETLQAETPPTNTVAPPQNPAEQEQIVAKQSALEEALRALEESEKALSDIQKIYDDNKSAMDEMETSMKSMEDLIRQSLDDPKAMSNLRKELGLPDSQETTGRDES